MRRLSTTPCRRAWGGETSRARTELALATSLAAWVDGMSGAPATLTAYATAQRTAMASALAVADSAATTVCEARHPEVENLSVADARWVRVPR